MAGSSHSGLSPGVQRACGRIDPRMPLAFVTTAGLSGGNSGEPGWALRVHRHAARPVAVNARAILHAPEPIDGAGKLAQELPGSKGR